MLVLLAAIMSIPLSLLLGSLTALKRDSKFDVSVSIGSLALAALPEFVIGIVADPAVRHPVFDWLPSVSRVDPDVPIANSSSSSSFRR